MFGQSIRVPWTVAIQKSLNWDKKWKQTLPLICDSQNQKVVGFVWEHEGHTTKAFNCSAISLNRRMFVSSSLNLAHRCTFITLISNVETLYYIDDSYVSSILSLCVWDSGHLLMNFAPVASGLGLRKTLKEYFLLAPSLRFATAWKFESTWISFETELPMKVESSSSSVSTFRFRSFRIFSWVLLFSFRRFVGF